MAERATNVPGIPGPSPQLNPQETIIRTLSPNLVQRMDAMLAADFNIGDISTVLRISSSIIVMYQTRRAELDALRQPSPLDLGSEPLTLTGGPNDQKGRSYRPGVIIGPGPQG